jgi:hypothetical protein
MKLGKFYALFESVLGNNIDYLYLQDTFSAPNYVPRSILSQRVDPHFHFNEWIKHLWTDFQNNGRLFMFALNRVYP